MPKPSLVDVFSLSDVLLQDNFNMYFSVAPVLTDVEIRQLRLQCMSTTLPGRTVEEAVAALFGYQVRFGGRNTVTGSFTINYIETRNLYVNRTLKRWTNMVRSKVTGHGVSKQIYAGRALLELLSEGGQVAGQVELINVWPSDIPEVNLDGGATGIVQLSAGFKFDEMVWRYAGGAGVTAVPLPDPSNLEDDS